MKRIQLSLVALLATTNLIMAGGDIIEVTPYEIEDVVASEMVEVVTPVEEIFVEAPVTVVEPEPIIVVEPKPIEIIAPVAAVASVSPIYVGIGISAARYSTNCGCAVKSGTDTTAGLSGRVGYDFNKYMGIEARGIVTSYKDNGGTIKHIGAFLKPMYPVTDGLNIYALGGVAKTTTQGELRRTNVTGLALGAGLEYDLSDDKKKDAKYDRKFDGIADQEKGFGVFADYERLYYKSGSPDLDAVSVGVTYDF